MLLSPWDWCVVAAVTAQATLLAYLPQPKLKALIVMLPVPLTLIMISIGQPVDATFLLGLLNLLLFIHVVRLLHLHLCFRIIPAIVLADLIYLLIGAGLAWLLPAEMAQAPQPMLLMAAATLAVAVVVRRWTPPREEPLHRTPLPIWIKMPIIGSIVLGLLLLKGLLAGFAATFPLVTTVAAYEARRSLSTLSREVAGALCAMTAMLLTVYFVEPFLLQWTENPLHARCASLLLAWGVFSSILLLIRWLDRPAAAPVPPATTTTATEPVSS